MRKKLGFPSILKFTLKALLVFICRVTLLSPLHRVLSGTQMCPDGGWGWHNEEVDLCDLIHVLAFNILPQTAVYMDLWVIISSFKQTSPQKNGHRAF